MRVCMFVINAFTHDARVAREAAALARAGHEVTVLAVRRSPDLPAREERDGYVVERLDLTTGLLGGLRRRFGRARAAAARGVVEGGADGGDAAPARASRAATLRPYLAPVTRTVSAVQYCLVAARRARELAPDVLHCHDFHTLPAGFLARRGAPVVYDSHELWAHLNIEHPTLRRTRRIAVEWLEGLFARRCAATITVSEAFADHLVARHRIARPVVLLNVPDTAAAPAQVEVPPSVPGSLLYVGGIQRNRGLEECVRALAELDGMRLVLLGPAVPAEEAALRALARDLGIADRVVFEPPVPATAVPQVASHAAIGLVPFRNTCLSHYLTLPNKLFESIHAGLPVVAADFPEFRRIVEGEGVGVVCDTADPRAIAAAVRAISDDPAAAARYRENARDAATRYTWEREAGKLTRLYASLEPVRAR